VKNSHWKLFQPITINGLELKNRITMMPMGTKLQSSIGEVTQNLIDYYEEVAKGGTGLIIVQAAYVEDEPTVDRLRIDSNKFVPGLNELAETIKFWGVRAAIQLNHPGYLFSKGLGIDRLEDDRIQKNIEDFEKASERAKRAGFEMVEIHGAHGYLIAQFLSGLTNTRVDGYGGTLEKRMTFAVHILRKVRGAVGEEFPVSFRISADEFLPGGITLDDSMKIAAALEREGVDLISVTAGKRPETTERSVQPMALPRGCLTPLSFSVKQSIGIPVLVAGRINDPALANSILEEGKADLIGMGRGLIADPYFPQKALSGELDQIRRCIACNCCHGKRMLRDLPIRCAINPEAARKRETALISVQRRKKVLIVGGGPSGLECAHSLFGRGHDVLLYEKSPLLGGKLRVASIPPHKDEIKELLDFLVKRVTRERVSLFLNHEVEKSIVDNLSPDAVVFATGSRPIFPDIPGLKRELCHTAEEVLTRSLDGGEVTVLGGGMVGCEVSEFLAVNGKKVTLIEVLPDLGLDMEPGTRKLLLRRLQENKLSIRTSTELFQIDGQRAFFRDKKGAEGSVNFDAIVLAVGYTSDNDLMKSMGTSLETHSIGDCCTPKGIYEAIHEGYRVGQLI
jgi:2,4-dienoyl-CoA reductase-like NADH-dependent reductase (Old Yellow Enzyme family)/thioredoxin reductase